MLRALRGKFSSSLPCLRVLRGGNHLFLYPIGFGMSLIPFDCFFQAFFKRGFGSEAEFAFGSRYIQLAAWLAVGFAGIPLDFTFPQEAISMQA